MPFESFADFYKSDAQSVVLLNAMPLAFLAWRAAAGSARRGEGGEAIEAVENGGAGVASQRRAAVRGFVALWTLVFAFETLVDPWATGPLVRALGVGDEVGGSAIMFVFVWLGDFRVLGLMWGVAALSDTRARHPLGPALARAAALTFAVPIVAGVCNLAARAAIPELPGQTLWVIYEIAFLGLAVAIGRAWVERTGVDAGTAADLRALAGYTAAYYALWASADLVILALGWDAGWALRVVPNQLYYGGWVIFAYARFVRSDPPGGSASNASAQAASSTSTHAAR